ncbi:MAG: 50S ribosome-binding GTPase [Oscillospiraceae bacterium]|nr:50S ribosome-binding GTPase [Oscillospiraceae bacterium]MBQ6802968.1 50S ribosome-binding GTPase [Oscillospiraceae bacterium]
MDKNIIVIGHVDHGKSTFMKALDLFINGRERIVGEDEAESRTVSYRIGEDSYKVFDYAGAYEYEENIGKNEEWAAILVCAATDGPMPQTTEQVRLCKERGIKRMALYFSKCDLVTDDELIDFIKMDVDDLLEENGYSCDCPILKASAEKACDWGEEEYKAKYITFLKEIHNMQ